jgi:hypothetical protein
MGVAKNLEQYGKVSKRCRSILILWLGLAFSLCGVTGCGGVTSALPPANPGPPPGNPTLSSIAVNPGSVSIEVASLQQFTATGTFSDGSTQDLTNSASWTSSDPSKATVQNSGLARAVAAGVATITASISGQSGTSTLTITAFSGPLPPAGGITAIPPNQPLGNNQIVDPGFEAGGTTWRIPSCFSVDSTTAHTGTHSLRFVAAPGCSTSLPASADVPRASGAARSYTLQGWVKGTRGTDVQVRLAVFDGADEGAIAGATLYVTPGTTWQFLQQTDIDFLPIHDGDKLLVSAIAQGTTGTVWFDDVQLIEQLPLPISSFLLYPNYQGILWGNGPQTIRMRVEVPNPLNMKVTETLQTESGSTIQTLTQPAQPSQEIDFDGTSLASGSYLLQTALTNAANQTVSTYPAYRIIKVDAALQGSLGYYIDTDNFLVRNGQKRFVWGVYDRWSSRRCGICTFNNENPYLQIPGFNGLSTVGSYADTMLNAEMNIVPFAGINLIPPNDQLTPWLAAVNSVGVGHLQIVNNWVKGDRNFPPWASNLSNQQLWQLAVSSMTGKPGALGFYTYDEPDDQSVIPTVFAQHVSMSTPGLIDFGVLINSRRIFRWRDMSDVLSSDPYPVGVIPALDEIAFGATLSPPMMRTSIWTRETVRQVYGSRPVWMVLQMYLQGGVFPTYDQMKMQAYKAIINGATGILWWGFVSESGIEYEWYVANNHQPYFDFKRISQEVMGLEANLISPPQQQLLQSVSDNRIEYLVKESPTQIVIFASNFSEVSLGSVSFTLSPTAPATTGPVQVYSENRTVNLNTGLSFTDSFNAYDVHVYILNRK